MKRHVGEKIADKRIPLWLKLMYTGWIAVWAPSYAFADGWQNFLWICDIANFVLLVAFWTESSLLFSSQLTGTLVIDLLWCVDLLVTLATGIHIIGGTEYMFDASISLPFRMLSLFHVMTPLLTVYGVFRLGYDRRGLMFQMMLALLVFLLSILVTDPERNINFAFEMSLKLPLELNLWANRLLLMIAYPLVICLPTHLLALRYLPSSQRRG
jgi:hypothetical protein